MEQIFSNLKDQLAASEEAKGLQQEFDIQQPDAVGVSIKIEEVAMIQIAKPMEESLKPENQAAVACCDFDLVKLELGC
ncbi:MAG: hypothetical protein ACOYIF_09245 [Acetivibrionales bacterium]